MDNRAKWRAYSLKYRKKLRQRVLQHYGPFCACCGEAEEAFLTMDHVYDNGAEHRKIHGRSSAALYNQIIKAGFPSIYQVLCFNCNNGKQGNNGMCPHQQKNNGQ